MKLLFVEDDKHLLRSVLYYFHDLGNVCEKADSVGAALEKLLLYSYDCVIIDIELPDGNGITLIEEINKKNIDTGIIILSANSNLDYKIKGLELGADDYLTKPFHLSELNARLRSIVRRRKQNGKNLIAFMGICIDTFSNEVKVNGEFLKLTKTEYELLVYFIYNKNKVLTKSSISEYLWGDFMDQADSHDAVYSHVKNLKKKMKAITPERYIHSLYGVGYIFKNE